MRCVIVGHGPSLLSETKGEKIDSFDYVIRLKRCQETLKYPEIYGTKTDIVGGSWTIAPQLKGIGDSKVSSNLHKEYWIFLDSRHKDVTASQINEMITYFEPNQCIIDAQLCLWCDEQYLKITKGEGHPHTSQGMKAIVYAMKHLPAVSSLTLAGFDNVSTGNFTWSVTRGPEHKYPNHNWKCEYEMLNVIEEYFNIPIERSL